MLAAVVIGPGTPLQLRSGGVFRGMVAEQDADAVRAAIEELGADVTAAAGKLAGVKAVQEVLARILDGGAAHVLGMPAHQAWAGVGFVADDGTADTLLRRLQPTLDLDEAGPLPLPAHGSTAKGVLAVAEAMTAADIAGAVVLADDFGDDLDAASGGVPGGHSAPGQRPGVAVDPAPGGGPRVRPDRGAAADPQPRRAPAPPARRDHRQEGPPRAPSAAPAAAPGDDHPVGGPAGRPARPGGVRRGRGAPADGLRDAAAGRVRGAHDRGGDRRGRRQGRSFPSWPAWPGSWASTSGW